MLLVCSGCQKLVMTSYIAPLRLKTAPSIVTTDRFLCQTRAPPVRIDFIKRLALPFVGTTCLGVFKQVRHPRQAFFPRDVAPNLDLRQDASNLLGHVRRQAIRSQAKRSLAIQPQNRWNRPHDQPMQGLVTCHDGGSTHKGISACCASPLICVLMSCSFATACRQPAGFDQMLSVRNDLDHLRAGHATSPNGEILDEQVAFQGARRNRW